MESTPAINFYLSYVEEQARAEFKDSKARVTEGTTDGQIHLDIQEDLFTNYLSEREQMEKTVCELKALLEEAKSKAQDQQADNTQDLQLKLTSLTKEKEALQKELDFMKKAAKTQVSEDASKIAALLSKTQALEGKHYRLMRDKVSELEDLKKSRAPNMIKVLNLSKENTKLLAGIKQLEEQLKFQHITWQQEKTSLLEEIEKSKASIPAEPELNHKLMAALKEAEHKLSSEREQWAEQKLVREAEMKMFSNCYVGELELCRQENTNLKDVLKKAQDELRSQGVLWQEEKTYFLQQLEKAKACNLALQNEKKAAVRNEKQKFKSEFVQWQQARHCLQEELDASHSRYLAQVRMHREEKAKLEAAVKAGKDQLERNHLWWQQENASLKVEMEKSRALSVAQLDDMRKQNTNFLTAVKTLEEELKKEHLKWQQVKDSLEEELKKSSQIHLNEKNNLTLALKQAEEKLKSEHLLWDQGKISLLKELEKAQNRYLAQLEANRQEKAELETALKSVNDQLEREQQEKVEKSREHNAFILLTTEKFKKTLQEKEQDWEKAECSLKAQLEEQEKQLAKKKKKKKWYQF